VGPTENLLHIGEFFELFYRFFGASNVGCGEGFHARNMILNLVAARGGTPNSFDGTLFSHGERRLYGVPRRSALLDHRLA